MKTTIDKRKAFKIGKDITLQPVFKINEKQGVEHKEVECRQIIMEIGSERHIIDFQAFFMFCYFCCSEELRQQLALKYERQINYIPYEVSFKLEESERTKPIVKRRIELPVDEISMAFAKNQGWDLFLKNKFGDVNYAQLWAKLNANKGKGK